MKLSAAIVAYVTSRHGLISAKTETNYRQSLAVLGAFLGDVEIADVTLDHLRAFRASLFDRTERYASAPQRPRKEGGLSAWTLNTHIRLARQLFKWLTDEGLLAANPAARLQVPEVGNEPAKGISLVDLHRMFDAARSSPRDFALLLFLADTGCRIGGVTGLTLGDLDLTQRCALVREKGKRGRPKVRAVFFNPVTADALAAWLQERSILPGANRTDRVFIGHKGPLTANGIYQVVARVGAAAGIEGRCNPHSFRHGLAQALLENGCDLARVSQILGHADVRVTARFYGVFTQGKLAEAHDRYSWLKPK